MLKRETITYRIDNFKHASTGEPSGWSVEFRKEGSKVIVALFWGDKEISTHEGNVTLHEFISMARDMSVSE